MKVLFGCTKGGLASNDTWTKLVHMLFSKNAKCLIMFLCLFFLSIKNGTFHWFRANQNSLFCKVCHHSKLFSSCTSLRPFGFMLKERIITFSSCLSSLLLYLTVLSPFLDLFFLLLLLLLFVCLFQLTADVVFFNEPSSTNFFQRHFHCLSVSVKPVVGLACAIPNGHLLSMSTGPMQSL